MLELCRLSFSLTNGLSSTLFADNNIYHVGCCTVKISFDLDTLAFVGGLNTFPNLDTSVGYAVVLTFLGANAPLGPASSEVLYVCLSVCL